MYSFCSKVGSVGDKLYAREIRYIFLGYSQTYKGYRYPYSKRRYISTDVSFFEQVYFYFVHRRDVHDESSTKNTLPIHVDTFESQEKESSKKVDKVNFRKIWKKDPPQSQVPCQTNSESRD